MLVHAALRESSSVVLRCVRRLALALLVCLLVGTTNHRVANAQAPSQIPSQSDSDAAPATLIPATSEAQQIVGALHQVLSANLRDGDAVGFNKRLARLKPVVASSFDFQAIARVAMGREINSLDAKEVARFERLLGDLSAATYADQFSGNESSVTFVVVYERPARGGRIVLRTHLQEPAQEQIVLDYVLHNTAQGLRIVNVVANGVSDLSLKRAQYAAVIRRGGVGSLLEKIETQLSQLTQSAAAGG